LNPSTAKSLRRSRAAPRLLSAVVSSDQVSRIAELLHEAAETHHRVYRITDGDDSDWASWYADWLLDLSELPELLGVVPVRSHLVHALVGLDRDYTAAQPSDPWEDWYAARLSTTFRS
jgi:hypothetical protein